MSNMLPMWEHDCHETVTEKDMPINPRNALFGGRVETVMFYDKFPRGHPERITRDFKSIDDYFGIVKCKVTPPSDLHIPVLPEFNRDLNKLTFDLKPKIGEWTTLELQKAINKGYKIDEIYEVLHWKETKNGMFKEYILNFLKIKQEASGWPDNVKTDEEKNKYISDYEKDMGIRLEKEKIKHNPGLRALAKLCLNSLWGKFAQKLNNPQSFFVTSTQQFYDRMKDELVEATSNSNVYIGVFTTSNARIRLYEQLEKLNKRVLVGTIWGNGPTSSAVVTLQTSCQPVQNATHTKQLMESRNAK
eukprot:NODE_37_length_2975_cov_25.939607_g22_i0.p1 GENE.NODE_37_length_2975_cov_25.939607_g22_i0~~NODE_37_length_2975_cov_25.939607_g22_i0.p1  ORF type:complete len:303 (-),score=26.59 NODE_37_length_2975_cov_25.939607_g22_i0:930-1838(-)